MTARTTRRETRPNQDAIFTAALESFSRSGFNGASMRTIATGAGTSLSNLYNYFPSKEDLLAEVLRNANSDLLAALRAALTKAGDDPADQLRDFVRTYVRWSIRRRDAGLVALTEFRYLTGALREEVVKARDETETLAVEIVERGAAKGSFATPHPHEAARGIVLLCSTVVMWYRPGGSRSPEQLADEQCRLALAMVEQA